MRLRANGDSDTDQDAFSAAANHGFLPRNGIMTTSQTVDGLAKAFGMAADLAAGLAVLAILFGGDEVTLTWSIGGAYPSPLLEAIGESPQGISWSHNNYEGDSSVTRQDAYLNEGDASSLIMSRFEDLYNSAESFTLDTIRGQYKKNQEYSINNNPYYYSAQFSGLLVVPAAHNFTLCCPVYELRTFPLSALTCVIVQSRMVHCFHQIHGSSPGPLRLCYSPFYPDHECRVCSWPSPRVRYYNGDC